MDAHPHRRHRRGESKTTLQEFSNARIADTVTGEVLENSGVTAGWDDDVSTLYRSD